MGNLGHGGARPNSGPARRVGSTRWMQEQRRKRRLGGVGQMPSKSAVPVVKPSDLPAGQGGVWDELAPHAIQAGTLTPATARSFRDLCEAVVLKRDMLALIEAEGLTTTAVSTRMEQDGSGEQVATAKAHPLLTRFTALMVRVEAGLLRFRLAPLGKEMPVAETPRDEFAEFDGLTLAKGA